MNDFIKDYPSRREQFEKERKDIEEYTCQHIYNPSDQDRSKKCLKCGYINNNEQL